MNNVIFHSGKVSIYTSSEPFHDIAQSVRDSVTYVCQLDADGNQIWQTNTGKNPVDSMVENNHSEILEKISQDITLWIALSRQEQAKKRETGDCINGRGDKIIRISRRIPTRVELEKIEEQYYKN